MKSGMLILFCVSMGFILSCIDENLNRLPYTKTEVGDCFADSTWTEQIILDALIGRWLWEYTNNGDAGLTREVIDSNYVFEFRPYSKVTLFQHGVFIESANFNIQKHSNSYFLNSETFIGSVTGYLSICDDKLILIGSVYDGADNYYRKIN